MSKTAEDQIKNAAQAYTRLQSLGTSNDYQAFIAGAYFASSSKDKRIAELEERVELAEDIEFILRLEIEQLKKLESEKANNRIFEIAEQAHKNYGISDSHFNEIKVLTKKNQ
jgi:hypothetical protein